MDEGNSSSGETELAMTEEPNPVVAAPTISPRVGGRPDSRVGERGEKVDETRVTTKADTPNGSPPSVVVPVRQPAANMVPKRVRHEWNLNGS